MNTLKLKVLLIVEKCNPEWFSVPLVGYNFYAELSKIVDVTLVTHQRNEKALKKFPEHKNIIYIQESNFSKSYHRIVANLTSIGSKNWPLYNALSILSYAEFDYKVYQKFKDSVLQGDYDIVHAITPIIPRYPVSLIKACKNTPFILGPVNGGVPFPSGFVKITIQEFAYFNFLKAIGRALIPGYTETYKKATQILAGSTYTLNLLKNLFNISDDRLTLFYENGLSKNFISSVQKSQKSDSVQLLFVGRLVPYKGADMLIESISNLSQNIQEKINLTIVGDGSERTYLENLVKQLNLESIVNFTGWVEQPETLKYYRKADIFCFPSIREFGGAVVLEAMACGLPCIVVNNGGIGEYVTDETGIKIEPISRKFLVKELAKAIEILVRDQTLRDKMSSSCIERVKEFEWNSKAKKLGEIYCKIMSKN